MPTRKRTKPEITHLYRRIFGGLSGVFFGHRLPAADRRVRVADAVRQRLRPLGADPYLMDAAYRWALASCRGEDSLRGYASQLAAYIQWSGHGSLSALITKTTRHTVIDYAAALRDGYSQRTTAQRLRVLSAFWGWLLEVGLTDRACPVGRRAKRLARVDQQRVAKADGTRQSLTATQAQDMLRWARQAGAPRFAVVAIMLGSGMRIGELAGLMWRHVAVDAAGSTTVAIRGKGDRLRKIALDAVGVAGIAAARGLHRSQVIPATRATMQRWIKDGARAIGRPEISSHDLRKTHATLLLEQGATLEQAQLRLGHSNPQLTLLTYTTRHRAISVETGIVLEGSNDTAASP